MMIYTVQAGDTIESIASAFGVSETRLVLDNGITNPIDLVIGQTIVITYPAQIHVVKEGDTLEQIALDQGVPIMQLFQFNPYLWDRDYIYPGEELIIRYDTTNVITTNGYAFPYINRRTLYKALPNLTYLSILNYRTLRRGDIESYYDDTELIETVKRFGVMPLMLVTGVSFQGERDPEMIYEILISPEYQVRHAQSMANIIRERGYYGVNITITYLNETNQELYLNYLRRVAAYLHNENFLVFITIDPNFAMEGNQNIFERVDYSQYSDLVDGIYIMRFFWGTQYGPPAPVSSVEDISQLVNYMVRMTQPEKMSVGFPLLGYDWALPYIQGYTRASSITLINALNLARTMGAVIYFDDVSKTPYFNYVMDESGRNLGHIVWFVDARSISAILDLVLSSGLNGTGLWNIMSFNPQLWLIINSTCVIEKLMIENS